MAQAIATAASMAISVVMNAVSVASAGSGSVGLDCCDVMDADGAVSPDINLASPKQYMFQSFIPKYRLPL